MKLKNRTYSSYYIDEIDSWGDLGDAVRKFGDKIHDNYEFLFPHDPNQDLGEAVFGKNKINAIIKGTFLSIDCLKNTFKLKNKMEVHKIVFSNYMAALSKNIATLLPENLN